MEKFMLFLNNLFKKINIKFLFAIFFFASLIYIFFPKLQERLVGEIILPDSLGIIIYTCFIVTSLFFVISFICYIFKIIRKIAISFFIPMQNFKKLTLDEYRFIVENFFDLSEKRFCLDAKINMTSSYISPLIKKHILIKTTNFFQANYGEYCIEFQLNEAVYTYINKNPEKWKFKLGNNEIIFDVRNQ